MLPVHRWNDQANIKTTPIKCLLCDDEALVTLRDSIDKYLQIERNTPVVDRQDIINEITKEIQSVRRELYDACDNPMNSNFMSRNLRHDLAEYIAERVLKKFEIMMKLYNKNTINGFVIGENNDR